MATSRATVVRALASPLVVLAVAGVVFAFGAGAWAFGILAAGWGVILVGHAINLARLVHWAAGGLDATVPESRGSWGGAWSAIYRRTRHRRAHERDLANTIERFQSAAEAIPDGIVVLDASNRIKWANRRAQALLGIDLRQDHAAPLAHIVRQPELVRYLDAGEAASGIVIGSPRDARVTLAIEVVPFGADERLLIARDVTELEAVARMRRDFIANVSHELKTPLTVISGFVETLQELDFDERQRARFLQLMREQAASMQRLVEDLVTLSALESEHNPLAEERFAIAPLLVAAAADAKSLSKGNHAISLELGDDATIAGSREELASAFGNLVSNAVRYTPAGGAIRLAWRVDSDGSGVFSVTDTGIGISAEHIPRLTERFYRVDRSRSRATGGTGLGLAIVKHVLLRHEAELEVASERGKGSAFAVRLPAARVDRAELPKSHETRLTRPVAAKPPL
jgi:two-component system phosphate regulon sensor histidine kinase PhoR